MTTEHYSGSTSGHRNLWVREQEQELGVTIEHVDHEAFCKALREATGRYYR